MRELIRSARLVMRTPAHPSLRGPSGLNVPGPAGEELAPRGGSVSTPGTTSLITTVWSSWRYLRLAMTISALSSASGLPGLPAPRYELAIS